MKKLFSLTLLLLCALLLLSFTACSESPSPSPTVPSYEPEEIAESQNHPQELVGTWIFTNDPRQLLTLDEDGSGFLYVSDEGLVNNFSWSTNAEQALFITDSQFGQGESFFSLRGNMLILTDDGPPYEELLFIREPNPRPFPIPDGLEDDIHSLTFGLNGVVYTLPIPLSTLLEDGWELVAALESGGWQILNNLEGRTLEPMHPSAPLRLVNGEQVIRVVISNPLHPIEYEGVEIPYYEGFVTEIRVATFFNEWAEFVLSGNVMIGSTFEDLPIADIDYWHVTHGTSTYLQYREGYKQISIRVNNETQLVEEFTLGISLNLYHFPR